MGPEKANNRLEELRASVEASVSALAVNPNPSTIFPSEQQQLQIQSSPERRATRAAAAAASPSSSASSSTPSSVLQVLSSSLGLAADERRAKTLTYIEKVNSFLSGTALWGGQQESASERLVYEIMLDRNFRLQPPPAESISPPTVFPLQEGLPTNSRTYHFGIEFSGELK